MILSQANNRDCQLDIKEGEGGMSLGQGLCSLDDFTQVPGSPGRSSGKEERL